MKESVEEVAVTAHDEPYSLSQLRRRALSDHPVPYSPITTHRVTWGSTVTLNESSTSPPSPLGSSFAAPGSTDCHCQKPTSPSSPLGRSQTLPDSKHARQAVQHTWALEYVALLLAVLITIALVLLLVFADGKPVSHFSALSLSFNTIISILAAVIHTALAYAIGSCLAQEKWNWYKTRPDSLAGFERFEQASRGPWGSFWLLIWINIRHWAALGALVTIVLLAFEPFLQAVVSFGGKLDAAGSLLPHARLGWVSRLDVGVYTDMGGAAVAMSLPDGGYISLSTFQSQPDMSMVAALYAGFDSGRATAGLEPSYTCSTGNCTWAPFTSLGVCSACKDVSGSLVRAVRNGTNLGTINSPGVMSIQGIFESHSLPYVKLSNLVANQMSGNEAYMAARAIANPGLTLSFQDIDTLISAVGIIKADPSYEQGATPWNETAVTATECALYFCAKALNSTVTHNVLDEDIIGTWADRVPTSSQPPSDWAGNRTAFAIYDAYNNYSLTTPSSMDPTSSIDVRRDDLQVRIPADALEQIVPALPANESQTVFNISAATVGSMTNYINNQFFASPYQPELVWPRAGRQGFSQAPCAQGLYESGDLAATFSLAATTLSHWMRSYSNLTQAGQQEEWVLHIEVQWWYTLAPLVMFVGGCVFVLLAIAETRALKLAPWKDDIIALITHTLNDEMIGKLREAEHEGKSWKMANRTIVKFEDTGNGWELKATQ